MRSPERHPDVRRLSCFELTEYSFPPAGRITRSALDLGSSPERPHTPPSQRAPAGPYTKDDDTRQRTPSAWSPSVHGSSPWRPVDADSDLDADADADAPGSDEDALGEEDDAMDVDETRADDPASDPHEDAFGEPLSPRSASPAASPPTNPTSPPTLPRVEPPGSPTKAPRAEGPPTDDGHTQTSAPGSSLRVPTPAQRPRPEPPSLPTPGRVLVPDSTQAPPSPLPPSSAPSASQSEVHASQPNESQPDPAPAAEGQPSQRESEGDAQPSRSQPAPKLVHSSQPWTSPAVTSTPLPAPAPPAVARAPPPNRAFSGTLALDAPWGALRGAGVGVGASVGGGKGKREGGAMSQGRVLVPDSDVSATTASQSQSLSLNQDWVQSPGVLRDQQSSEIPKEMAEPKKRAQEVDESQTQPESQVPAVPQARDQPHDEQQAQQRPTPGRAQASQVLEPAAQPQTQDESQGSKSGQSLSYATDSQEVPAPGAQSEREAALEPSQLPVIPEDESVRVDDADEEDAPRIGGDAQPNEKAADALEPEQEPEAPRARDASQEADEQPQASVAGAAAAEEDVSIGTQDHDTADEAQAEDALAGPRGSSQSDDAMDVDVSGEVPGESDMEIVQGSVLDEQILELPEDAQEPGAPEPQDEDEIMDSDDERTDREVRAALVAQSQAAYAVQAVVREEVAEVVEERTRAAPATPDAEEEPPSFANTSFPKRLLETFKRLLPGGGPSALPRDSPASEALKEVEKVHDTAVSNAEPSASGSKSAAVDARGPEAPRTPQKTYHDAEAWKAPSFMRKQSAEAMLKSGLQRTPEPVKAKSPVSSSAPKPPSPKPAPTQSTSRLVPPPNSPIKPTPHHKALAALSVSTSSKTQDTSSTSRAISGTTAQSTSTLPTSVATDPASTSSMKPRRVLKRRLAAPAMPPHEKKRRLTTTEVIEIPSSPEMDKHDLPPPKKKVMRKVLHGPPPGPADKGKAREVGEGHREEARVGAAAQDQDERVLKGEGEERDQDGPVKAGAAPMPPQKPVQRVYASKRGSTLPRKESTPIPPVKAAALNKLSAKAQGKQPLREPPPAEPATAALADEPEEDPRATPPPPDRPVVPRSPHKSYPVQRRKVGGMKLDLDTKTLDLPPEQLVSWPKLRKMMHAHGRAQFKAKQAREEVGRKQQADETGKVKGKGKGKEVDRKK